MTRQNALLTTLWKQTWPMALGIFALLGFQLVDSAFIARLGSDALAAQSFTFPLSFLIIGVQVGIGIAMAAMISRTLGAGASERARPLSLLLLAVGALLTAVLVVLLGGLQTPIFMLLGADKALLPMIASYWWPQLLAAWAGALLYFNYSLFRAHGDTWLPGKMMVLTSLVNLGLDPLLIFGVGPWPGLGLAGAPLATLVAFSIGIAVTSARLARHQWLSRVGLLQEARVSAVPFFGIACPAVLGQLLPPLAAMLALSMVSGLGEVYVAAWGLASRLETVSLMVILAMTMSLPPWLGRCYGAADWEQIRRLLGLAIKVALMWQLLLASVMLISAPWVAHWLAGDPEVAAAFVPLLRWLQPSYAALGVCMLTVSAGNALGWPARAMVLSALRLFVCYLPCIWVGMQLAGWPGVAVGAALGNLLAGLVAWRMLVRALAAKPIFKGQAV